ncbi:cellulose biosynthesis protein [Oxalicibacterium flavum]|uniref:Cellulose biosynthesis protein n=2 Tax=Oxalicibacterium flavum TaxID=179467 RepID=A0A8J2ULF6_9BURK|nr:cellulose biosynthesis protein [Oxalicibacterium flavum]
MLALMLPLLVPIALPPALANAPVSQEENLRNLLQAARLWDGKDRPDIARDFLQKALLIRPDYADAILMLGMVELRTGRNNVALQLLQRLERVAPGSRQLAELRTSYRVATYDKEKLARMRLLARAGQIEEAEKLLRQLYPNGPPRGEAALEYYSIIGSAPRNAAQARAALARLYHETGDVRYRLGELNILADDYDTRHAAIRGYEELAESRSVNTRRLQESWRHNLYRLPNDAATVDAIRRYLKTFPDDQSMVTQIAAVEKNAAQEASVEAGGGSEIVLDRQAADPYIVARAQALDALNHGRFDAAERQLQQLLRARPNDDEVLGGLGLLNLRRGRHAEAEDYFVRAARAAGGSSRWNSLAGTARFWQYLAEADAYLEAERLLEAEAMVRNALALQPGSPDGLALLGNVRLAAGDPADAERLFRDALRREGDNGRAMRGLVSVLSRTERREEAYALLADFARRHPKEDMKYAGVHADLLREEADAELAAGRPGSAIQALEAAVVLQPDNAWHRFTLARLYASLDLPQLARQVMDDGVARLPADPEMRYARALNFISLGENARALDDLSRISERDRSEGMRSAEVRAALNLAIESARQRLAAGDADQARRIMGDAEYIATRADSMSATRQVVEAWFSLDQPERGLSLMRARLEPDSAVDDQLYFASLLNRAQRDAELAAWLPALTDAVAQQPPGDLLAGNAVRLHEIRSALQDRDLVRLVDSGRLEEARRMVAARAAGEQGDPSRRTLARQWLIVRKPEQAIPLLQGLVRRQSSDAESRSALAVAYHEAGDHAAARRETAELLTMTRADDLSSRIEIARLMIRIEDYSGAQQMLAALSAQAQNNPDILFLQGRAARGLGDYRQAMQYLKRSEAMSSTAHLTTQVAPEVARDLLPPQAPRQTEAVSSGQERPWNRLLTPMAGAAVPAAGDSLPVLTASGNPERDRAREEIAAIEERRQPRIEAGFDFLSKSSSDGTSTFHGREVPLVAWVPVGYDGHAFVHADRVELDAGNLPAARYDASLFGTVQLGGTDLPGDVPQRVSGTSVGVGYEKDRLRYDIGVIGFGFPVTNVVGGVQKEWRVGDIDYALGFARRPQVSSLLSYAGAVDPLSGRTWGGVTDNAVTARASTKVNDNYLFASAAYGLLRGRNTRDNDRLALRAGVDRDLYRTDRLIVNAGLTLSHLQYGNNQGFYTYGHGGYYSPQRSTGLSIPLQINGRTERLSYMLRASVSYSDTREDDADLYPNDPALQAQAVAAGSPYPAYYDSARHPGSKGGGMGHALRAVAEYRLTPHWTLGGRIDIDRSAYYTPNAALVYLRYHFKPQTGPVSLWPTTVTPYSRY